MIIEDDNNTVWGPPGDPIPQISVGTLVYDSLLKHVEKPQALIDVKTKEFISYKKLLGLTCSLAESLLNFGYKNSEILAVSSENSIHFFIPVIAALYIGASIAPINHNYISTELIHILNISKPTIIFCSKKVAHKYVALKTNLKFIKQIIIIDSRNAFEGCETLVSFIEGNLGRQDLVYKTSIADVDVKNHAAFIMCSSGTTGLPKAVIQTHHAVMTRYTHARNPKLHPKTDTLFAFLPLYHGFGFITGLMSIVQGRKILVMDKFEEKLFLQTIQDFRITCLNLVPSLIVLLAKSPLVKSYDMSSVKDILCGAAALGKDTERALWDRFNLNDFRQGFGLTETVLSVTMVSVGEGKRGSSGKVVPHMFCKIRDPQTGRSLGPKQAGEICVKGPLVTKGYYKNDKATKNTFTSDGWFLTGDIGYFDEEEYLFVVDRIKELIKYKGFQVAPAELEAILLNNPKIKDCGVVGMPDEAAGELPTAFVVRHPNVNLTEKEVQTFVAGQVSYQKHLRGGVIFVSEIPKSASGKILRRDLKKMLNYHKSKL